MDILEGKWKQLRGLLQQRWGRQQNDDADRIEGSRNQLLGLLQERDGRARDARRKETRRKH